MDFSSPGENGCFSFTALFPFCFQTSTKKEHNNHDFWSGLQELLNQTFCYSFKSPSKWEFLCLILALSLSMLCSNISRNELQNVLHLA